MPCKKCGSPSGAAELCPKCGGWIVLAQQPVIVPIRIPQAVLQMIGDGALRLSRGTFQCKHEKALKLLDNVWTFAHSGVGKWGAEHEMMNAFDSVRLDCLRLKNLRSSLRMKYVAPKGPLQVVEVLSDRTSWIAAMDSLANYRTLLKGAEHQIKRLTLCAENRSKGPALFHNFTRLFFNKVPTAVCIHNSKAVNGEGGTLRCLLRAASRSCARAPYLPRQFDHHRGLQDS